MAPQTFMAPLVEAENASEWVNYSLENQAWIVESKAAYEEALVGTDARRFLQENGIPGQIWRLSDGDSGVPVTQTATSGLLAPSWQMSPPPMNMSIVNYDFLSNPVFRQVYEGAAGSHGPVFSQVLNLTWLIDDMGYDGNLTHPVSFLLSPIFAMLSNSQRQQTITAFLVSVFPWDLLLTDVMIDGVNGTVAVMNGTCGDAYTYMINGTEAFYLGAGDLHDGNYTEMKVVTEVAPFLEVPSGQCSYSLSIYPSAEYQHPYNTNKPAVYTTVAVLAFFFTAVIFLLYDCMVQYRQEAVMDAANTTNAIVQSLFPSNVRDRIIRDVEEQAQEELRRKKAAVTDDVQAMEDLDSRGNEVVDVYGTKPIADLFPAATVLFADIVGFTAWSSVRDPCQVFTLLETLYHSFDEIANRRRVFKVETVGDCYVAVAGLPVPRRDHAVVMARFARDCLYRMNDLVKKLEITLGPDTGDLSMRFGLHSGPVTAGVLRGEKSRFQLFGDTVNTAARIESGGERNRIHLSQETADLIIGSGKSHWVEKREGLVQAKGKGTIQTYWLVSKARSSSTRSARSEGTSSDFSESTPREVSSPLKATVPAVPKTGAGIAREKIQRLVDWNTEILLRLLKQVVAKRQSAPVTVNSEPPRETYGKSHETTVLEEVVEIVHLPDYQATGETGTDSIALAPQVKSQLRELVHITASLYRDNPFHSFEHASHVTMSVVKLLGRIVAPDRSKLDPNHEDVAASLHDHTYGITSDPLTQFACVYAALIHDVDHTGVPNAQLVREQESVAKVYKNKSVAEQNSVDVAWDLLRDPSFNELRSVIYTNAAEESRFRQLVVNSVMATDIADKELKALRNARWEKAFAGSQREESPKDAINRKATIVIEHLIQASDVAHTMQHWHIYRKWNERLFHEMCRAYQIGRADQNPADFWYQGEIGFFDFYIIPLAKKLKECGVFGVSSDEYLNYALQNRKEWELRGQDVVASMVEKYGATVSKQETSLDDIQENEHDPLRSEIGHPRTVSSMNDQEVTNKTDRRLSPASYAMSLSSSLISSMEQRMKEIKTRKLSSA